MNMPKKYILILLMGLCANILCAQLPVYTCDFEDPAENSQWVLNYNLSKLQLENNWFIGEPGDFSVDGNNIPSFIYAPGSLKSESYIPKISFI